VIVMSEVRTKAEEHAEKIATRLRDAGWTVEIETEDHPGAKFASGEWMLSDRRSVLLTARREWYEETIFLAWSSVTSGARRTTRLGYCVQSWPTGPKRRIRTWRHLRIVVQHAAEGT
jgi:hypothetical protein